MTEIYHSNLKRARARDKVLEFLIKFLKNWILKV